MILITYQNNCLYLRLNKKLCSNNTFLIKYLVIHTLRIVMQFIILPITTRCKYLLCFFFLNWYFVSFITNRYFFLQYYLFYFLHCFGFYQVPLSAYLFYIAVIGFFSHVFTACHRISPKQKLLNLFVKLSSIELL